MINIRGFVVPLLLAIIGLLLVGGGIYIYSQQAKTSITGPSGVATTTQTLKNNQASTKPYPSTNSTISDSNCPTLAHDFGLGATDAQTGGDLGLLINFLDSHNYYGDARSDGTFNEQTSSSLRGWQESVGLKDELGVVGPKTRIAIVQSCNKQ
jgi:hypothetical protein